MLLSSGMGHADVAQYVQIICSSNLKKSSLQSEKNGKKKTSFFLPETVYVRDLSLGKKKRKGGKMGKETLGILPSMRGGLQKGQLQRVQVSYVPGTVGVTWPGPGPATFKWQTISAPPNIVPVQSAKVLMPLVKISGDFLGKIILVFLQEDFSP
jgi:hypothetical protein